MKFLFFDTECAKINRLNSYLCSFGYVLCDDKFNILEKEDILINPTQYDDHIINDIIEYSKNDLASAPKFPFYYDKIKKLLSDKKTIVIGQTVYMDAKYINCSLKMYKLEPINYPFYDLSEIFRNMNGNMLVKSLEEEARMLGLDVSQGDRHTSLNDAYITYLCFKELCNNESLDGFSLLKKYKALKGESKDYGVLLIDNLINLSNNMGNNSQNRKRFNIFLHRIKKREEAKQDLLGKKIYIDSLYTKTHYKEMFLIVQLIKNHGGYFTFKKEEANYLVYLENNDIKHNKKEIVNLNEFFKIIDFNQNKVENYYSFIVHFDILLSKEEKSLKNIIKSDGIKRLKKILKKIII